MTISQAAAANFVPILARVVLAFAFIPAGWNKLMTESDFTPAQADRLRELRVVDATSDSASIRVASWRQETPEEAPVAKPKPSQGDDRSEDKEVTTGASSGQSATPTPPAERVSDPAVPAANPVKARALHNVTLLVDSVAWPYPVWLGWLAALTELLAGGLALLGLFTRLAGLTLAGTMAVAFYLTSLGPFLETWVFSMAIPDYTRFVAQIALFALAFGLVFSGAGALSLDRMLFGRPRAAEPNGRKKYETT